jgi:glycosyltransferase involved in cell wall biosynthesis
MNPYKLKVLMISSDRNILTPRSAVAERMKEYASLVGELHIVLLSKKSLGLSATQLSENLWIYPTASSIRWFYPFDASRIGKKIVFDQKFVRGKSLITTQDPFESGWAGLKIKRKWRIPLEVQLHTDPFSPYFYGLLNKIRRILANRVIRSADRIRVVTHTLGDKIATHYNIEHTKISVLPIFVDKERILNEQITFDLRAKYGWQFTLLTVARLTPEKNLSFALNVLKKVSERFHSVGLVIVGSGPLEETLKNQAEKMGLKNKVVFEGWKEDLASYYRTANAYIQTSKFEGYGLSLIEAGLSGLPVVTTPVGIANELENGHDAYICPEGDINYFRDAILDLIENNEARETLKINIKNTLNSKLLSKEEYLKQLISGWEETSHRIDINH